MMSRHAMANFAASGDPCHSKFTDTTASLHQTVAMLTRPACEWPEHLRNDTHMLAFSPLLNAELLVPERIAFELASENDRIDDLNEKVHFQRLREILEEMTPANAQRAYTAARRFVIEGGVRRQDDIFHFGMTHPKIKPFIDAAYRTIPQEFTGLSGRVFQCQHCKGLMHAVRQGAVEKMHCLNVSCRTDNPPAAEEVGTGDEWRMLCGELIIFWAAPGYDEIRLHSALSAREPGSWDLYPRLDEVDVANSDGAVGIDVKAYGQPQYLGWKLGQASPNEPLKRYSRGIVAIPDRFVKANSQYVRTAREEFLSTRQPGHAGWDLEFMAMKDVVREFGK